MARPIKRLQAEPGVVKELRRRSRAASSTVRERERADIILLRLDGVSVTAAAMRLKTTAKRVSTWSQRRPRAEALGNVEFTMRGLRRRQL